MKVRVGSGFDVHRLKAGRPCLLGCVEIPGRQGPTGHSDGDPVAHALADALLGAVGAGDIGEHFPDTDPAWKDCPGEQILTEVVVILRNKGFVPVNADITVFLERPRLSRFKAPIAARLEELLGVDAGAVNVKAKTSEGFGAIGRGACIGAHATVLVCALSEPA